MHVHVPAPLNSPDLVPLDNLAASGCLLLNLSVFEVLLLLCFRGPYTLRQKMATLSLIVSGESRDIELMHADVGLERLTKRNEGENSTTILPCCILSNFYWPDVISATNYELHGTNGTVLAPGFPGRKGEVEDN